MNTKNKGFSIVEIIVVVAIIGIIGGIGWVFFTKNYTVTSPTNNKSSISNQKVVTPKTDQCNGANTDATNGNFCAKDIGISLNVPDVFNGKIKKIDNYPVYTQADFSAPLTPFGKSIAAYQANIEGKDQEYSLTIATEPLRDFQVKSQVPALFKKATGQIHYADNREVTSSSINGIKFYNYGTGDAGYLSSIYLAVINDKLVVVALNTHQLPVPMDDLIDTTKLYNQFKDKIKSLKVV